MDQSPHWTCNLNQKTCLYLTFFDLENGNIIYFNLMQWTYSISYKKVLDYCTNLGVSSLSQLKYKYCYLLFLHWDKMRPLIFQNWLSILGKLPSVSYLNMLSFHLNCILLLKFYYFKENAFCLCSITITFYFYIIFYFIYYDLLRLSNYTGINL